MFKIIALIILSFNFAFSFLLNILSLTSSKNKIPSNVSDVYDEETYSKWLSFHKENNFVSLIKLCINFIVDILLISFNVFSIFTNQASHNYYNDALIVLAVYFVSTIFIDIIFNYINTMVVEEKYGFNKTTKKTFIFDQIKEICISFCLITGLLMLFVVIHTNLGDWTILLFTGIMVGLVLLITTLYPFFSKIFNHFTPLEDGELKDKLMALLTKHGYTIKEIKVMDASKRTSKSNAYFSGIGKTKTIVLYDNLIASMTSDEICAVFAHELGHGIHHDTLKGSLFSFFTIAIIVVLSWILVKYNNIYNDFGFNYLNYGFALYLIISVIVPFVSPVIGLLSNYRSRKAEYLADKQALLDGYGNNLISALKKLSRDNFANLAPNKLIVKLMYSHPPMADRISAIENSDLYKQTTNE